MIEGIVLGVLSTAAIILLGVGLTVGDATCIFIGLLVLMFDFGIGYFIFSK